MQKFLREMALCFSAGGIGALAKSGIVWLCANFAGSTLASHLASAQYPSAFYTRIVWGGLAAWLFLLPLARSSSWVVRGLLWGVIAALLQIVVLPLVSHGGIHLSLVPLLSVFVLCCVWGVATALALRLFGA